ncbi:glycosyltransferase family 4 protein [Tepidicaulis marinus]|uniref:glycosyltransferase family 4 protein n=1 Tax=Tepidicaulis marinus TaxID=1333998 RepID=UPI0018CF6028|nr:glycosyltransferase family 4 protein [Tepidicaulis marinus]
MAGSTRGDVPFGSRQPDRREPARRSAHAFLSCQTFAPPPADIFFGYTAKPVIWGLLAAWLTRVPDRAALITGLGYAFTGEARGKRALVQKILRGLYKHALRRATLIFFQNQDDKDDFARMNLLPAGVPVVIVNGSGIDTNTFTPAPLPSGPRRFLLIARLIGDKGIREYAAAAAQLRVAVPEAEFHLVGGLDPNPDGIPEAEVRKWQEAGHITWHGSLEDVREAIAASHIYVLPSYREGTPRTVLEAMAMGRPIITTDAPGCRETVINGVNGFLVPVQNISALKEAMEHFLISPQIIETMGEESRRIAVEKYDVRKINAAMLTAMKL